MELTCHGGPCACMEPNAMEKIGGIHLVHHREGLCAKMHPHQNKVCPFDKTSSTIVFLSLFCPENIYNMIYFRQKRCTCSKQGKIWSFWTEFEFKAKKEKEETSSGLLLAKVAQVLAGLLYRVPMSDISSDISSWAEPTSVLRCGKRT